MVGWLVGWVGRRWNEVLLRDGRVVRVGEGEKDTRKAEKRGRYLSSYCGAGGGRGGDMRQ